VTDFILLTFHLVGQTVKQSKQPESVHLRRKSSLRQWLFSVLS